MKCSPVGQDTEPKIADIHDVTVIMCMVEKKRSTVYNVL